MNALQQTYAHLAQSLQADATLQLASLVAWLDPLWQDDGDDDTWEWHDEVNVFNTALRICRQVFPVIYTHALHLLRQDTSYARIETFLCDAIQQEGIPLDHLDIMTWGIPLPAYGVLLDDPDFYQMHPDTVPVLACFGISPEPNPYHVDVPDVALQAMTHIGHDLLQDDADWHPAWRDVGWALLWLASSTNNSLCDLEYEMLMEFEPLSWHDIDFARELIQEADDVMGKVIQGLVWLNHQPERLDTLQHNAKRILNALKKGESHAKRCSLAWTNT
jgi:hypothetical protein